MRFYIVDVFAEEKYAGNQLAVFRGNPDEALMRRLAQEMHFSETTFITNEEAQNGGYDIRIFTPASELRFAGHPTLGTAYIVQREILRKPVPELILNEKVGQIPVRFGEDGVLWMQQKEPQFGHIYEPEIIAEALGIEVDELDSSYPIQEISTGTAFIIAPLKTLKAVKQAEVNLPKFKELIQAGKNALGADAIFIFCPETEKAENQFHARCFVHLHGIPEDAATGSANGNFAAWLAKYRYLGDSRVNARVEQGYEIGRPALIYLDALDTGESISIKVGGRVQMVAQGDLVD